MLGMKRGHTCSCGQRLRGGARLGGQAGQPGGGPGEGRLRVLRVIIDDVAIVKVSTVIIDAG